jgi:uncharacterized protein YdaU (DUF1376 family)
MKLGMEGIGIYWCIIEMLYEQNGYISLSNIEAIAFELHTECERIKNVLQGYELFKFKEDKFFSESVLRRLRKINSKSEKAKKSAQIRWNKADASNADAMRTQCNGNAVNKIKGNKIKEDTVPPKIEWVKEYCSQRGDKVDADNWYSFYSAKGWMIGKNKMVDWKAAVRTWEKNNKEEEKPYRPKVKTLKPEDIR